MKSVIIGESYVNALVIVAMAPSGDIRYSPIVMDIEFEPPVPAGGTHVKAVDVLHDVVLHAS